MNTKTISAVVVVIVLLALAYFFLGAKSTTPEAAVTGTTTQATASAKMVPGALDSQRDPLMAGTWQDTTDASSTRTFSMDGSVTDMYAGDASATETGTWEVVDPTKEQIGVPAESVAGMTVLRLNFPSIGALFFTVLSVDSTHLQMSYLGRGNTLSYTKIK